MERDDQRRRLAEHLEAEATAIATDQNGLADMRRSRAIGMVDLAAELDVIGPKARGRLVQGFESHQLSPEQIAEMMAD
jgi:hypothetical protein